MDTFEKCSILRFKRKHVSECPETLMVTSKRAKLDSTPVVFKYAGSFQEDISLESVIKNALQRNETAEQKPSQSKLPESTSEAAAVAPPSLSEKQESCKSKRNSYDFKEVTVGKKRKIGDNLLVVDIDDFPDFKGKGNDLVTCNGLKMVRNKLSLNDEQCSYNSDGDDMYELYYHSWDPEDDEKFLDDDSTEAPDPLDLLYIAPMDTDVYVFESDEENPKGLEDSDSNGEDHWKNDYPDSDNSGTSFSSSPSSGSVHGSSSYRDSNWDRQVFCCAARRRDDFDYDPTEFFDRYAYHVQSDDSYSD